MLEFFRTHGKPLQFLLLLVIIVAFVFVGVEGYIRMADSANLTVAKVGGFEIKQAELDQAHRQTVERMRQQMPGVDVKLFDTPESKQRVLDDLVRERVLRTAVVKQNLSVSDEQLQRKFAADPQFAQIRTPDGAVSKEFLSMRGISSAAFAEQLRDDFAMRQVMEGVNGSQIAGTTATNTALDALLERREVQVQRFDAKEYLAKVNPSDADIEAYYKANTAQFRTTEEARIEYVVLDLDAMKKQLTLSEDELRSYYDQNIARYTSAEERHAAHILIKVEPAASADDKAKAKARAEALLAQARKNPAGFAELARKNSQDEGSAPNGGDLEFFGRGAMVKPFDEAVFAMKAGEISNLVESEFGFHIIKLIETRGGEKKPFESVRAQIVEEVSKPKAQEAYAAAAEQFSNLVYEQSDSLQPVVDRLKLSKVEATVQRQPAPGAVGPLGQPKLLDAIFSADVVKNKRNTEAVETGPNQLVSARIVEHRPERVLPLAEVRERVVAQVRAKQAADAAKKDGEARVAALKANAAEMLGTPLVLSRTKIEGQPRQVVDAALRADVAKGPVAVGVDLGEQGFVVLKVVKKIEREANDPDTERAKPYVTQALAAAEQMAYYDALKRRYKTEVKPLPAAAVADEAASAASR
ncbi:MAG: SurA N-terminal domain-containing protein [Pseudomonadota bacterium]